VVEETLAEIIPAEFLVTKVKKTVTVEVEVDSNATEDEINAAAAQLLTGSV
jgi:hypothetical protein